MGAKLRWGTFETWLLQAEKKFTRETYISRGRKENPFPCCALVFMLFYNPKTYAWEAFPLPTHVEDRSFRWETDTDSYCKFREENGLDYLSVGLAFFTAGGSILPDTSYESEMDGIYIHVEGVNRSRGVRPNSLPKIRTFVTSHGLVQEVPWDKVIVEPFPPGVCEACLSTGGRHDQARFVCPTTRSRR